MSNDNPFGPNGWTPERLGSLEGRTYVITGGNAGAGFEASRILLSKGAKVVMLNRSQERSAAAVEALRGEFGEGANVSFFIMDLAVLDSVRNAAAKVLEEVEKVDALICNAAIAQIGRQELTVDGFESQLGVNHYGHFLLCGLLYDRVAESNGRIVVVGSEGYKMGLKAIKFHDMNWDEGYAPNDAYCHSKLAQMMFAYELQQRVAASGDDVGVYVCHPGASKTSLIDEKATGVTRFFAGILMKLPLAQSAEKGSYPEVMCATEADLPQSPYWGPSGRWNWVGPVGECELKPFVRERDVAAKLWRLSEEQTGLTWSP